MKLNITPGPWEYHAETYNTDNRDRVSIGSIKGGDWFIAEIQNSCNENNLSDDEESEANATAIVTAVNNTYHKGINPEAVEELLQVAKSIWRSNILDPESQEHISKIIQKATL